MIKKQRLEIQLQTAHQEIRYLREQIQAMETSKFWKLRKIVLAVKGRVIFAMERLGFKSLIERKVNGHSQIPDGIAVDHASTSDTKDINQSQERDSSEQIKAIFTNYSCVAFDAFIDSQAELLLPTSDEPAISIILVLYNRVELTYMCLRSLCEHPGIDPIEIIIIDNASSDETQLFLEKVKGAKVVFNPENIFFPAAVNQGARLAKGKYLLLLNNDAQLLPGSLSSAIKTYESADDIGVVGGRIILLDGSLQEAGSMIWSDGSCLGYGRGDDPSAPMYMFRRDIDYCSGAFFLTSRDLFFEMNGFDEDYSPAYYEETDYCVRLLKSGKRIIYDPNAVILHYEFASSNSSLDAVELQKMHRELFVSKHRDWLKEQFPSMQSNILQARSRKQSTLKRVLFIDDFVPHPWMGAGLPRSNAILSYLVELGYFVTFYPMLSSANDTWDCIYSDISNVVEVMVGPEYGKLGLKDFWEQRREDYDCLLVSRPHNMATVRGILEHTPISSGDQKLIYDAEAIFANREILKLALQGNKPSPEDAQNLINEELQLAQGADAIITVSELESTQFTRRGHSNVHVLGHNFDLQFSETAFDARQDFLFVGAMPDDDSPNTDSMLWFANEILPIIRQKKEVQARLLVVGTNRSQRIKDLSSEQIIILNRVDDLTPLYSNTRVFVAPTRFAAGISLKVGEAAANGIPVVTTSLIASQLGWQSGTELLVADDPESFAACCLQLYRNRDMWEMIRTNAFKAMQRDFSHSKFNESLKAVMASVLVD